MIRHSPASSMSNQEYIAVGRHPPFLSLLLKPVGLPYAAACSAESASFRPTERQHVWSLLPLKYQGRIEQCSFRKPAIIWSLLLPFIILISYPNVKILPPSVSASLIGGIRFFSSSLSCKTSPDAAANAASGHQAYISSSLSSCIPLLIP